MYIAITFLVLCFSKNTAAQQIEQFSQYALSNFITNPAAAVEKDNPHLNFFYRRQWLGAFNGDEPTTFLLAAQMRLEQFENVGVGAKLYTDKTGPTRRTGIELSYAYKMKLGDSKSKLALGISAMALQYNIDFTRLIASDPSDPALLASIDNKITGDMDAGAFLYGKNYYAGITVNQIFNSNFVFGDDTTGVLQLARHYFINAGYKYKLSDSFDLEPSILIKAVEAAPVQYDINALLVYENAYWIGANYRTQDAVGIIAGLKFNDVWKLGYAYDITISNLNQVSTGSHEIMLGYKFSRKEVY